MVDRRAFVTRGTAGVVGVLGLSCAPESADGADLVETAGPGGSANTAASLENNIYTRVLGIQPHLGAHEHITTLGGSRMPPYVMQAMIDANDFFIDMHELTEAAGRRVAELMGAEGALVTAGGFSSMLLGAAACLTGTDMERIRALPRVTWPRRQCLIQTAHRFSYDHAYRAAGMEVVYVETREAMIDRIDHRTAMLAAVSAVERGYPIAPPKPLARTEPADASIIMPEELVEIGRDHGVPVMIDMASDLPPWDNLTRFIRTGADLVVISGGKGILAPQSTGILAGRGDLIEAATMNATPNDHIGRGMKVGKEEIMALVVGLEHAVEADQDEVMASWNSRARWLATELQDVPGLRAEYGLNNAGYADVDLSWDPAVIPLSSTDVKRALREGSPRIRYDGTTVRTRQLRPGEERLIATRLRELFGAASV